MSAPEQQLLITEDQIAAPLAEVLEDVTTKPPGSPPKEPSKSLEQSLNDLFPEQQYDEKSIQRAKEILGELANELTAEQLKDTLTEIQYLAECWLDSFERKIFKGLTLKELLHEKGGL